MLRPGRHKQPQSDERKLVGMLRNNPGRTKHRAYLEPETGGKLKRPNSLRRKMIGHLAD